AFNFSYPLGSCFLKKGFQSLFIKPFSHFRQCCHGRNCFLSFSRGKITKQAWINNPWFPFLCDLYSKEPFMVHLAEPIHYPCAVEIETRCYGMLKRVKAGAFAENVLSARIDVPPYRLEERMPRSYPFKV